MESGMREQPKSLPENFDAVYRAIFMEREGNKLASFVRPSEVRKMAEGRGPLLGPEEIAYIQEHDPELLPLFERTFGQWKTEDWQKLWQKRQEARQAEEQNRASQERAQSEERGRRALEEGAE